MAKLTPADIDSFRRIGLRLDPEGQFWHQGVRITHKRLAQALHRWIDRLDDGRYIVRLDAQRYAYLTVDDAPYLVRTVAFGADEIALRLSDGRCEPLDPKTLSLSEDGRRLYCAIPRRCEVSSPAAARPSKSGQSSAAKHDRSTPDFPARFSRQAFYLMAEHIEESEQGLLFRRGGLSFPIPCLDS